MPQGFTDREVADQSGRTFLVTGANTGIGFETARVLARRGGRVLLGCRSRQRAEDAMATIRSESPEADVEFLQLDQADLASVRAPADGRTDWFTPFWPAGQSEDCLRLNVWTPALDNGKRPVLVWFHGGGYSRGSGGSSAYDGINMASRGDVVSVTVNHRLNVFGYAALGGVLGGDFERAGNAGLLDLVLSLEWVRDNIERFGGDPDNVMIFGESGGGPRRGGAGGKDARRPAGGHPMAKSSPTRRSAGSPGSRTRATSTASGPATTSRGASAACSTASSPATWTATATATSSARAATALSSTACTGLSRCAPMSRSPRSTRRARWKASRCRFPEALSGPYGWQLSAKAPTSVIAGAGRPGSFRYSLTVPDTVSVTPMR